MTMTYRYIADTYAWIAYFNKKRFRELIENEIIETPTIVIAEVVRTLRRRKIEPKMIEKILQFISNRGLILPLDAESAKKGGEISNEENLSLVDAIIYAYVTDDNCRLITGDEHFKNKKNIIFEKE